ncbi:LXG domain of WXG superfamily protein [Streptococcus equinus]|uniref:T7SS effector LXG polymorphic toxin n=1 Tax=Streptococcus equinus TaxID=1335 RepID=UPI000887C924|nr:T7SS effector LXG polymorphic toxin [Streptococcus equinus]SDQ02831.1 LXG domain of WXG superfamily protein [Streptococcus equinus]
MKIKMSEVIAQRDSLKSSISQTKSQLSSAKKKLKSAANSEALKGDVKDAIDNKITNYQVPLLTNYVNSLDVISQGYDNLISTFKSIVSENSDSAIIDTDVLQQMVDKFDSPLEQLKTSSDAINKAIDDVADIVTLTKVTTDDAISEFRVAKKVLTNTIKDMGTFNNTVFTSEAGDILDEQNTQIGSLSNLGSSSYTSKKSKDFYKKTAFKTEVKETKLVVSGKARRDQLKNELAKNLYDSKYSGYMVETNSLPTPILLTLEKKGSDYYTEFEKVMDSDTAKRLGQLFKLLPDNLTKDILKSDGFWEILSSVEKSGAKGSKAVDLVLEGLSKYEGLGKSSKYLSKLGELSGKVASPVKEGVKWGIEKISGFTSLEKAVTTGKNFVGDAKFLGKGIKILGKVGTVMTVADIGFEGVSGGIEEYSKTKDVGKAVKHGALDAVSSIGPLEGATLGAAVGGVPGAVIGAGVGAAIQGVKWIEPNFFDDPVKGTKDIIKKVGKGVSEATKATTHVFKKI